MAQSGLAKLRRRVSRELDVPTEETVQSDVSATPADQVAQHKLLTRAQILATAVFVGFVALSVLAARPGDSSANLTHGAGV